VLHWFLPTNGDSRTDLSLGNAVGAAGHRAVEGGSERVPDVGYLGQIARAAAGGRGETNEEVAERIAEYYALGIDEFILSGYPHLEEAYQVGEGLIPVLRRRGLMASRALTD
jgi:alkanesulfonate monooxygenase